ncbi:MAG: hypothetical protein GY801_44790, partial [bacterium]|nr:hypothetical protein [bacterium]
AAYGIYESTFRLSQKSKYVLCGITIVFFAAVSYLQVVQPHRSYSDNFKVFSEQLHEELPTDAHLLFDDFHLGGLYNYYTMGKFYNDRWAVFSSQAVEEFLVQPRPVFFLTREQTSLHDTQKLHLRFYKNSPPFWIFEVSRQTEEGMR